jgi:hypothetical protein
LREIKEFRALPNICWRTTEHETLPLRTHHVHGARALFVASIASTISVGSGAELQSAIVNAQPGDTILLARSRLSATSR